MRHLVPDCRFRLKPAKDGAVFGRALFVFAWLLFLCLPATPSLYAQQESKMVALVNGAIVYRSDLDEALVRYYQPLGIPSAVHPHQDSEGVMEVLLENLIDRELLVQEAQRQGLTVSTARVLRRIEELPEPLKPAAGKAADGNGDSVEEEDAFYRYVYKGMLIERLLEKELPQIGAVSERSARAYYEENAALFIHPEEVHLRHILIKLPPNVSMAERQDAYLKIQAIEQQLAEGENFTTLAVDFSQCPSRARGGDLGYLTRDQLYPSLAQTAFNLVPGQISRIVESPAGYHLLLVSHRRPARRLSFLMVREALQKQLRSERQQRAARRFIRELRERAAIERFLN
jgi:parvulin-like peptidyl-prolyl isomerase